MEPGWARVGLERGWAWLVMHVLRHAADCGCISRNRSAAVGIVVAVSAGHAMHDKNLKSMVAGWISRCL